ncbi:metal-sensing transcriptional repressor [uncultured Phascolarctobacterium sp.]|jgi:DNA-binding FrmR family transcriptional regulator|uniref:metal-sensing transcriptional repressor n=1 Tax=uncultured Phascolarctobacterium sp. TaxID=512296 RepID=UPI0025E5BCB2|nr:metal-sensing transcriptional repressor [uncultured Phascolarctobacterium sp.]
MTMPHPHIHKNKKAVANRLSRIEGHIRAVKNMIEDDRDCPEVLIQIAAVRKALDNCAKIILKDHLEHCILHAVQKGREVEAVADLEIAIDRYLR